MEYRNRWHTGKFHNKKVTVIEKKRNLSNFIPSSVQIGGFTTGLQLLTLKIEAFFGMPGPRDEIWSQNPMHSVGVVSGEQ